MNSQDASEESNDEGRKSADAVKDRLQEVRKLLNKFERVNQYLERSAKDGDMEFEKPKLAGGRQGGFQEKKLKLTMADEKDDGGEFDGFEDEVGPDNFHVIAKLGQGSFGIVYLVEKLNVTTNEMGITEKA